MGRRRSRVSGAPEVMGEFPMGCLAEEIDTPDNADGPKVRALISIASNPVLSAPNGERLAAALEGLDFMLSLDVYLNETTRHADVILPALSPLQEPHYDIAFTQFAWTHAARFSPPLLPAPENHWPEWRILMRLAAMLDGHAAAADVDARDEDALRKDLQSMFAAAGLPEEQQAERIAALLRASAHLTGPERQLDLALRGGPWGDAFGKRPDGLSLAKLLESPHGIAVGPLQPRLPGVLRTPDGLIQAAPPPLLDDLARVEAALSETQAASHPGEGHALTVIGRRDLRSNNSWMHNLPTLAKGPDRCLALVHPHDAAAAGIADGALAQLEGTAGRRIAVRVKYSEDMRIGVISLPHGWGHDLPGTTQRLANERPGANLNALLDEHLRDPLSGTSVLSGVTVRLRALATETT
jgi:anaerobic selenocysteine-containing dehydrogenase